MGTAGRERCSSICMLSDLEVHTVHPRIGRSGRPLSSIAHPDAQLPVPGSSEDVWRRAAQSVVLRRRGHHSAGLDSGPCHHRAEAVSVGRRRGTEPFTSGIVLRRLAAGRAVILLPRRPSPEAPVGTGPGRRAPTASPRSSGDLSCCAGSGRMTLPGTWTRRHRSRTAPFTGIIASEKETLP